VSTPKLSIEPPFQPRAAEAGSDQEPAIQRPLGREFEDIYRLEGPRLARYFQRRIRPSDEAGDLVHESFVRLASFMAHSPLVNPAAYLQRIARNLLFDRSKRLEHRLEHRHVPIDRSTELSVEPDQEHWIEAQEVLLVYRRALDELPRRTRDIFLLHRMDDLTYREIGARLRISIPTVQYHVARALAHIDAALDLG
jgi:RNA polymerase sigma-70 factor (ECF subfamily)